VSWMETGVDVENRRLMVSGEIDDELVGKCIRGLYAIIDHGGVGEPIEVLITSSGGDCYTALGLYDVLRQAKVPIHTCTYGRGMSAAIILTLAGERRIALPNTSFMDHSLHAGTEGKLPSMQDDLREFKRLNEVFLTICAERTQHKDIGWWRRYLRHRDRYMDANKALELGIVTEVINDGQ